MKRFYCAIILLIIIISSSILLNNQISKKAEDLLDLTENQPDGNIIISWWEENDFWFETLLPKDLVDPISSNIIHLEKREDNTAILEKIRTGAKKILESTEFNAKNVF